MKSSGYCGRDLNNDQKNEESIAEMLAQHHLT